MWQVCGASFMSIAMEDKEKHPLGLKAGDLTTQQQTQPSNRSQVTMHAEHAPPNTQVCDEEDTSHRQVGQNYIR